MLNEILGQAARFNQLLTRKFGIAGGAPSPQLTPEIQPIFEIEGGPESRILASELLATGFLSVPAAAGNNSLVSLGNPLGSNIVVVVEHVMFGLPVTGGAVLAGIQAGLISGVAPGAQQVLFRDTRANPNLTAFRLPTARVAGNNAAAALPASCYFYRYTAAAVTYDLEIPMVLSPGWALVIGAQTVNLAINACFAWREVPLAQGEVGPF